MFSTSKSYQLVRIVPLQRWKRELDEEIHQYNQRWVDVHSLQAKNRHIRYVSCCTHSITERVVMPLGSPPLGSFGEDEDEEPEGGSPHGIYDKVEDDPESPYE